MSDLPSSRTPKQTTMAYLTTTRVEREYIDQHADAIVFSLIGEFLEPKGIEVKLINPASFPNPILTARFPRVPLWTVLNDICRVCDCEVVVNDTGAVVFRSLPVEERLKRAIQASETAKRFKMQD